MVSVLVSSAVVRGFEPQSGQTRTRTRTHARTHPPTTRFLVESRQAPFNLMVCEQQRYTLYVDRQDRTSTFLKNTCFFFVIYGRNIFSLMKGSVVLRI
jgi:hypothetical protein